MKHLAYTRLALAFTMLLSGVLLGARTAAGAFLLGAAFLALLDVVVNDFYSHAQCGRLCVCKRLAAHRHFLYTGLGAACIAAMFPLTTLAFTLWSMALFAQATAAVSLAAVDTHVRYVLPRKPT